MTQEMYNEIIGCRRDLIAAKTQAIVDRANLEVYLKAIIENQRIMFDRIHRLELMVGEIRRFE